MPSAVSIVTPSLNQGRFLAATIESVQQQGGEWDHLVADGGSTDETLDVLARYGDRIRWYREPDDGQSDAINRAIARTSHPIVAWLNSDDIYLPGAIEAAVAALDANPDAPFVYGDAVWLDEAGRDLGPIVSVRPYAPDRLVKERDFICQPTTFFRRDAFDAVGGLDESLHYVMDYDLWIRLSRLGEPVYLQGVPMAGVRLHRAAKTYLGGETLWKEMSEMLARHGARRLPGYYRVQRGAERVQRGMVLAGLVDVCSPSALATLLRRRTWRVIRARLRRGPR